MRFLGFIPHQPNCKHYLHHQITNLINLFSLCFSELRSQSRRPNLDHQLPVHRPGLHRRRPVHLRSPPVRASTGKDAKAVGGGEEGEEKGENG